jgi:hypothetical protein
MPLFTFNRRPRRNTPAPCPVCHSDEGVPRFDVTRPAFRCTSCRQIWAHTDSDHPAPAAV